MNKKIALLTISVFTGVSFFILFWLLGSLVFEENIFIYALIAGVVFAISIYIILYLIECKFIKMQGEFEKGLNSFLSKDNGSVFVNQNKYTVCTIYTFSDKLLIKVYEKPFETFIILYDEIDEMHIKYANLWIVSENKQNYMISSSGSNRIYKQIENYASFKNNEK